MKGFKNCFTHYPQCPVNSSNYQWIQRSRSASRSTENTSVDILFPLSGRKPSASESLCPWDGSRSQPLKITFHAGQVNHTSFTFFPQMETTTYTPVNHQAANMTGTLPLFRVSLRTPSLNLMAFFTLLLR